jgi:hypothetical protein
VPEYLPDYASAPLRRFMTYFDESVRLLRLGMRGIGALRGMPTMLEILAPWNPAFAALKDPEHEVSDDESEKAKRALEKAKEHAGFAEKECSSGFPLLHAHTLVGLWGAIEASIEDMLVAILMNEPVVLESEAFSRLKISLGEFQRLEKEDQMRFILSETERQSGSGKHGVDTFEFVLDRFELSGPVEPEIKKLIWEMHHVRNILVRRGGLADRRLVLACPWMNLKQGDLISVKHETLLDYGGALCRYLLVITHRLGTRYGVDINARIKAEFAKREPTVPTRDGW